MQPVLVRTFSCTNLFTLKVPAVKDFRAAVVRLVFLSHTMPRYLNVSV